jgi:hypothetical protein
MLVCGHLWNTDTLFFVFLYDLFNDALSSLEYRKAGNNELENMWKEAVGARFAVLSQYLPLGTKKNN